MAIQVQPTTGRIIPYRLTVDQFLMSIAAGVFPDNARVELLGGVLVETMTKGNPHDYTLDTVSQDLRHLTPEGWILREDKSLQLDHRSRPEPDIAIVRGPRSRFAHRTPHASETTMIVEVADSSYRVDRGEKYWRYASARIPTYWIVNLNQSQVEVYRDPAGKGPSADYRSSEIFGLDASVPVILDGVEVGQIVVKDIMP